MGYAFPCKCFQKMRIFFPAQTPFFVNSMQKNEISEIPERIIENKCNKLISKCVLKGGDVYDCVEELKLM